MKIALLGFDFTSANKGCEALCYSFIDIMCKICANREFEIHNYSYSDLGDIPTAFPKVSFFYHRLHVKNVYYDIKLIKEFRSYNAIFDITFGDGFSDIYGRMWNVITNTAKQMAILSGKPFILLPQTYGPYNNRILRMWAMHIIKKSSVAFSRDKLSTDFIEKVSKHKIYTATDID
jgi:polysaccharide pyruvyl transferase WcaK-like protein